MMSIAHCKRLVANPNTDRRVRYQALHILAGLCFMCSRTAVARGVCSEHLPKREAALSRRSSLNGLRNREWRKNIGRCVRSSCRQKSAPGHIHCLVHLEEMRVNARERRTKRIIGGLCGRDGCKNRLKSRSLCGKHLIEMMAANRKRRA